MPLDEKKTQKVKSYLKKNIRQYKCPLCGNQVYKIGNIISPSTLDNDGEVYAGSNTDPMIQIICSKCSNISLLAANNLEIFA